MLSAFRAKSKSTDILFRIFLDFDFLVVFLGFSIPFFEFFLGISLVVLLNRTDMTD